jgi:hypothetical protein
MELQTAVLITPAIIARGHIAHGFAQYRMARFHLKTLEKP